MHIHRSKYRAEPRHNTRSGNYFVCHIVAHKGARAGGNRADEIPFSRENASVDGTQCTGRDKKKKKKDRARSLQRKDRPETLCARAREKAKRVNERERRHSILRGRASFSRALSLSVNNKAPPLFLPALRARTIMLCACKFEALARASFTREKLAL